MKNYNKNKESSYLMYLDARNLYRLAMPQKLPVGGFKWEKNILKFNGDFIKSYDEDSDKGYILEVDVKYPKNLHYLHNNLPFLPRKMEIRKFEKIVCTLYHKKICCPHKSFKTNIKSWINIEKSTRCN